MAYVTLQDLIDRHGQQKLVQLTDKVNKPATTIDETTVEKHIVDASSMIDGYIAKRVTLPLATVPAMLTKIGVDLAWYYLNGANVDEKSATAIAYRDALNWLRDVSKGLIVIGDGEGETPAPAGGGQVLTSEPNRIFTRTSLGEF